MCAVADRPDITKGHYDGHDETVDKLFVLLQGSGSMRMVSCISDGQHPM